VDADAASKVASLLRAGRWFGGLPRAFSDQLLQAALLRTLAPGERVFFAGDPPNGMFGVIDGAIRISGSAEGGKESLTMFCECPYWFGESGVLDGLQRSRDAIAEVESRVAHVPQSALLQILEAEPRYYRELGALVTSKLKLAFIALDDAALQPLPIRLARRLVLIAEGYGEWHDRSSRVIDTNQEQLAQMLSTSRQTVNQLLKALEGDGLVRLSYGRVEIIDLESLRRAAKWARVPL
jgi:CRP-like cAMP-binding protein